MKIENLGKAQNLVSKIREKEKQLRIIKSDSFQFSDLPFCCSDERAVIESDILSHPSIISKFLAIILEEKLAELKEDYKRLDNEGYIDDPEF